mgnify:CR=1 FL=1
MVGKRQDLVKVTVEIFGEQYTIKGTEDPEYIQLLAQRIDQRMRALHQKNPSLGVSKLAILTAVNLLDELSKLQDDYDQLVKLLEERQRRSDR